MLLSRKEYQEKIQERLRKYYASLKTRPNKMKLAEEMGLGKMALFKIANSNLSEYSLAKIDYYLQERGF